MTTLSTPITKETLVGDIAAHHPLATRVFARHHIDFCCGGGRPLQEVCGAAGLDVSHVLDEISVELMRDEAVVRWDVEPLDRLIDHILSKYHASLREELPRLEAMARKVVRVHGDKDPERLSALLHAFLALKNELDGHMLKEEQILFPMIRDGYGAGAEGPVAVMEHEHATAGDLLRTIRELTDNFTVPDAACNTWRALWYGFEALESDLHEHIHLENNILFPRALASA